MADACKDEGNALYKSKEWLKAAAAYTKGIKADPQHHVLYRCVRVHRLAQESRMPPRSQSTPFAPPCEAWSYATMLR